MKTFNEMKEEILNEAVSPHMKNGAIAKINNSIIENLAGIMKILREINKTGTSKELPVPNEYVSFQMQKLETAGNALITARDELESLLK